MEELVTCEGTVHSVIFQNAENGYTVLRLLTEEGEVITVVGCIPCVAPGEPLAVSGVPETHPQHGEQLRAVELERSLPEDEEEIFSYLSSGVCKGVGPATARRIVERFGPETLDVLEREPERLTTLKGITARKVLTDGAIRNAIKACLAMSGSTNAVMHLTAIAHEAELDIKVLDAQGEEIELRDDEEDTYQNINQIRDDDYQPYREDADAQFSAAGYTIKESSDDDDLSVGDAVDDSADDYGDDSYDE